MESPPDKQHELLARLQSDSTDTWSDEELTALHDLLTGSAAARKALLEDEGLRYAATVVLAHAGWSVDRILAAADAASFPGAPAPRVPDAPVPRVEAFEPPPGRAWSVALVLSLLIASLAGGLTTLHPASPFRSWLFDWLGLPDPTDTAEGATELAQVDRPADGPAAFPGTELAGGERERAVAPAPALPGIGEQKPPPNSTLGQPASHAAVRPAEPPDAAAQGKPPAEGEKGNAGPADDDLSDHPLSLELTKAGYNLLAAVRAAMSDGAVADAGRMLIENVAEEDIGLLPDLSQPGLWCSYSVSLQRFLQDHPERVAPTQQHLETVGELRLQAAIRERDVAAVESVAERFPKTPAAAQAYRWLGDRWLAAGDVVRAAGCYERMVAWASRTDRPQGELRLRLAAALTGREPPPRAGAERGPAPVPSLLEYNGLRLPGPECEQLLRETAERARAAGAPRGGVLAPDLLAAPLPATPRLKRWTEVPIGDALLRPQRDRYPDIDWISRAIAGAGTDKLLIVGAQSQITAIRRETGKQQWTQESASGGSYPQAWDGTPFQPLIAGDRLFIRRAPKGPPELVCMDVDQRREFWVSEQRLFVVSDPLWGADRVYALTLEVDVVSAPRASGKPDPRKRSKRAKTLLVLQLTAFDAESGTVVSQRPLLRFQDLWHATIPCRATWIEDRVVATLGGATFCAELSGRVAWVRKHPWTPPTETPGWLRMCAPAPYITGRTALVAQPGVRGVCRLDLDTGKLLWERDLADLRRVIGLCHERLMVQTEHQLLGLRVEDGEIAWSLSVENPLEAFLCGGPGGLVYACSELPEPRRWRPALVWVNPVDGKEVARRPLEELVSDGRKSLHHPPRLGPFLRDGDRWLIGYDEGEPKPRSRTFWEIAWGG